MGRSMREPCGVLEVFYYLELDGSYMAMYTCKNCVVHLRLVYLMHFIICTLYFKKKR